MIPYLYQLRESLWLKIVLVSLLSSSVAVATYYLSINLLGLDTLPSVYMAVGTTLLSSIVFGKFAANASVKVTDYLARAIMIATGKGEEVKRPSEDELSRPAKEYIAHLAKNVMDISDTVKNRGLENEGELIFYRAISNNLTQPLIVLDTQQIIKFANESAIKYLELPANDIIGQYFYDAANLSFVSDNTLETWLTGCREGAVVENEVWERVRLNLPEEKRKQFDLTAHYRKDDSTDIELLMTFFDRTMHYERDDHDLSFISLAVHELRTPLTIMRGYIEVFEDEVSEHLDAEQKTFMHNMSASAQQLSAFVSNILNVARVEENAMYLKLKEEKWDEVLTQACKDMQLRAQVHDKNIIIEVAENMPTIGVDKVSVYEVMNNILDNAIKYTHTKETITVKTYVNNNMIETTITDKGVGIPSNLIAHVFDKFYRAHSSKNSVGGTGLGLYLCRAIVQAHGGQIWVNSKEGQGSTFGFTLPIYSNVADQVNKDDNKGIVRSAHGWIKNHSLYRG